MKHLFLYIRFLLFFLLTLLTRITAAQEMPPIPVDPEIRIGTLSNGLTYYIRKNNLPEQRADFYIVQKVGSILEEENQRGLAHFLEHMCFNGTRNFPGNSLKEYLETIGVKFGENLNASTSIDETIYYISNVPVAREGAVDSCLLILHDWSGDLELKEEEIDKERGVIHEEWRTMTDARERMYEKILPVAYQGDRYAERMPIGLMSVVDSFPYQDLRDYYHKWYRPDLQGVIIIGDIDVDKIEKKIESTFADIPAPVNPAERIYYPVTDNVEPLIAIATDPEASSTNIWVFNKHDVVPNEKKVTMDYLVYDYARTLITNMLNARLNELRQSADPPFISVFTYDSGFFLSQTKDALTGMIRSSEEGITKALTAYLREIERANRFGFTEGEYTRAKAEYLRELESQYQEREKTKNAAYADQYLRHFLLNEPIPGIENEYAIMTQLIPSLPVELINSILSSWISEENLVITIMGPEKAGLVYPDTSELLEIIRQVREEDPEHYTDQVSDEPLLSNLPEAGQITEEENNGIYGTTIWQLSNGATVVVKPTDFKEDEILMKGMSFGGSSLMPETEIVNILSLNNLLAIGGVGNFKRTDLDKMLAGKKAFAGLNISTNTQTINAGCSPQDLETMMQLVYLNFTSIRKDEEAFLSFKSRTRAALENQAANPMAAFVDSMDVTLFNHHPRSRRMKADMIENIDYAKALEMGKERYADASGFTFIFVGNIDMERLRPMVELYLASLPGLNRQETYKDNHMDIAPGRVNTLFKKQQEKPKATITSILSGKMDYTFGNAVKMEVLTQVLTLLYTEKVREEEGGSYYISVHNSLGKHPKEVFLLQIFFETDPAKWEQLMEIIYGEIETIALHGPSQTELDKVKEFMLKKHEEELKENSYWLNRLDDYYYTRVDLVNGFNELLQEITAQDIRELAAFITSQNNRVEIVMISDENNQ